MRQGTLGDFDPELKKIPPADGKHKDCYEVRDGTIVHPLLTKGSVDHREFQLSIAIQALEGNTLVVLPTGLGKTLVAALVAVEVLHHDMGKVVFLAPTKPLAQQHMGSFGNIIAGLVPMQLFTGATPAPKRKMLWAETKVIFATPQGISNDIDKGRYDLKDVGMIIFDEAHRAVGDYAYVNIADTYMAQREKPLVLGLTASPGSDTAKINEVMRNLDIEHVEARGEDDPDVSPYIKSVTITTRKVKLSSYMVRARKALDSTFSSYVTRLKRQGLLRHRKKGQMVTKKDIIQIGKDIGARLSMASKGEKGSLWGAMHNQAVALHVSNCLELLETQGVEPTLAYIDRLRNDDKRKRSVKSFLKDKHIIEAFDNLVRHRGVSHPKVDKMMEVIRGQMDEDPDSLIMVFSQFRDTILGLHRTLRSAGYSSERFVGQAHRKGDAGLSQKEQAAVLDRFRKREFNVLVASSVAEEGIDIPAVDLVVFYEPIPSAVRAIQRRGRTGRTTMGKVVVLVTEDSRDEGFLYAEMGRERKMKGIVRKMSGRRRKGT